MAHTQGFITMRHSGDLTDSNKNIKGVLRWDDHLGHKQTLYLQEEDTAQIGREPDNHVSLLSPHISRRHAVIVWRGGGFEIADLGSTNGTQVNGEYVTQPRSLKDGDVIRLYDVELVFYEPVADEIVTEAELESGGTVILPSTAPQPRLIISAGPQEGREIFLLGGTMTIGRDTAKVAWDIAVQDHALSRPHAKIERQDDDFTLTDLGSANGTRVNGTKITEPTSLQDGDVITMGQTTFLFRTR